MSKAHNLKMNKMGFMRHVLILSVVLWTGSALAGGMRWPVGLSYVSGFDDIVDLYEDNLDAQGYWTQSVDSWPIGISFQPYYQFDSGLRIGGDFGPIIVFAGDVDHFQMPVRVTAGYTFWQDGPVSPYVRVGPSYHIASGDYVDGSNLGFIGAVGIELLKSRNFMLGLEAAYDSAEVDIEDWTKGGRSEGVKATEFVLSLLFIFK